MIKSVVRGIRSIVIKVGTSTLTAGGQFDERRIAKLADELVPFLRKGIRVSVVSSGAIGAGMTILKQKKRPKKMESLQAAAAVGQRYLMQCWEQAFSRHGFSTGQVLLTWDDMDHKKSKRYVNVKNTLREIQNHGLVPVINENDTVATDEIRFGDNDHLSALVAILMKADALIIFSDTNGFYDAVDRRIPVVKDVNSILRYIKHRETNYTRGGMPSKIEAVRKCVSSGIPVFLANGRDSNALSRLFKGKIGTIFLSSVKRRHDLMHYYNHASRKTAKVS